MINELTIAATSYPNLRVLLSTNPAAVGKYINYLNPQGHTPLFLASAAGKTKCVVEILKIPEIDVNVQVTASADAGSTPIYGKFFFFLRTWPHSVSGATKGGKSDILALLLFAGADYERIKNNAGVSAKQHLLKYIFQNSLESRSVSRAHFSLTHLQHSVEQMAEVYKVFKEGPHRMLERWPILREIESTCDIFFGFFFSAKPNLHVFFFSWNLSNFEFRLQSPSWSCSWTP